MGRPILCYVTDRGSLRPSNALLRGANFSVARGYATDASDEVAAVENEFAGLVEKIGEIAEAGIDWIQIREKDLSGRALARLTQRAIERAASTAGAAAEVTRILVNDRVDVALAEGANGVHLGERSLPVREVRNLTRGMLAARNTDEHFLVGCSCHSLEAAQYAADGGADYLFFGPVFATPAKLEYGTPQGLTRLAEVCRAVSIPVLAIGGITMENAGDCLSAGAAGIAAIRMFQDAAASESGSANSGKTDLLNAKEIVAALRALKS